MNRLIKETNFVDKNNNQIFDAGEGVSQFDYTLDAQGRKLSAVEKFWMDINDDDVLDEIFNNVRWSYDNAGRLIYEEFDHYDDEYDQTSEWLYDLVGNRLQQTVNGKYTLYDYDANDRLLTEIAGEKKTVYGYDHTQQTSKIVSENGEIVSTTTYEYDVQGRMSVVTIITGNRTEITKYEYGTDGIRVSAEHEIYVDGELQSKTRTEYLNDPKSLTGYSQVLRQTEYDAEGNVIKTISYVIGHQRISQTIEINGEKTEYYFTFDGHGSTRVLLDLAGAVIQLYSFDAYGNALGFNTSEALTEFLYSGEQFDSKIGQQYLRQRYYDPTTGRFNRLDPFFGNITDPQSLHKYLYAHDDSVNGIDPSGEYFTPIVLLVSSLIFGTAMYMGGVGMLLSPPVLLTAGSTFLVVNLLFFLGANFNLLMFAPLRSEIKGLEFLTNYDVANMDNHSIHKDEVRDMLAVLFNVSSNTPPPINWIWNIWRQAISDIYYWTQGDTGPDINQVCGVWVDKVVDEYRIRLGREGYTDVVAKFAEMGITFRKVYWQSIGNNQHVSLCIRLTNKDGKIEEWQLDDGWEFHFVGSPYLRNTTNDPKFINSEQISVEAKQPDNK
jgi:RHS repeat-associated protein